MHYASALETLLHADAQRMAALRLLRSFKHECWIGAGFIRDAVWDHLHHYAPAVPAGDVDVIWLDPHNASADIDAGLEAHLSAQAPHYRWSVKNQARMHLRNHDYPYASLNEALWHWPETATAVAVRLRDDDRLDVIAPFGLDDLFTLHLRPTPRFEQEKHHLYQQRVTEKAWLARYPQLILC